MLTNVGAAVYFNVEVSIFLFVVILLVGWLFDSLLYISAYPKLAWQGCIRLLLLNVTDMFV